MDVFHNFLIFYIRTHQWNKPPVAEESHIESGIPAALSLSLHPHISCVIRRRNVSSKGKMPPRTPKESQACTGQRTLRCDFIHCSQTSNAIVMRMIIYVSGLKAFSCMLWSSQFTGNKESRPLFLYPASQNNITPCCNPPFLSPSLPLSLALICRGNEAQSPAEELRAAQGTLQCKCQVITRKLGEWKHTGWK